MAVLQDFRNFHYDATQKVTQLVQTLSLSGLAIIWLFSKKNSSEIFEIPLDLKLPFFLLLVVMSLDFLQHFSRAVIWHVYYRLKEDKLRVNMEPDDKSKSVNEQKTMYAPACINYLAYALFYSKSFVLICAYSMLLKFTFVGIAFK